MISDDYFMNRAYWQIGRQTWLVTDRQGGRQFKVYKNSKAKIPYSKPGTKQLSIWQLGQTGN